MDHRNHMRTFEKHRFLVPRQLGQHSTAPFLPPRPSHLSQITFFCRASFFVAPLYKSSKVTETHTLNCVLSLPIWIPTKKNK
uniref:Uncharacterized protein n=1 Tax=Neovison vison TaxID=452646 RepID=A0A8C7EJ48_NEOVI